MPPTSRLSAPHELRREALNTIAPSFSDFDSFVSAPVITNVLSSDGNRIDNTYKNYNEKGELTTTTTAVYERMR